MTSRDTIVHVQSLQLLSSFNVQKNQFSDHPTLPNFAGNISNLFRHLQFIFDLNLIKAIALTIVGFEFSTFAEIYKFRLKCCEFCQKHQIFCYFPYFGISYATIAISQTKTMVKEGEKVITFVLDYPGVPPTGLALIRKANSYQFIKQNSSDIPPFTQRWKDEIFENSKPKRIIFLSGKGLTDLNKAQSFFAAYNPVVITLKETLAHMMNSLVEKVLHLMGEKIDPYDIETPCFGRFYIRYNGKSVIQATETDIAPFEQSIVIDNDSLKSVSFYCAFPVIKPPQFVKEIKLSSFKSMKVKVTLKLDVNSFYDFKVESFDQEETKKNVAEEKIPKENVLNSSSGKPIMLDKAQMVFDKQHFSVSYFAYGKEYNINGSDGEAKTPIYITFNEKKPIVGKAAQEMYEEKPKFVVFDLIKLCSVSTDEIFNPKWGFHLSKESESLILTFETFEDERKSNVEFLLAIILKKGKDRIKKETGKRMEEIEIKFDGFSPNEILKKNFVEAGKLLKINIVFV